MIKRKPLLVSTSILLALTLLISFTPALLLKHQLKQQLLLLGADRVEVESLYLNPWSGYVELKGLAATAAARPDLKIGHLLSEISYRALWDKRLQITLLQLADAELHLQQQDQQWRLGPVLLPASAPGSDNQEQTPSTWRGGLNGFTASNISSSLTTPQMTQQLVIDQAQLQQPLHQWTPQQQTHFSLQGRLNDSPLSINTQGTPLAQQPTITLEIKLQALALAAITRPWLEGLQGELSTDLKLQIEQLDNGLQLSQSGSINLSNFSFTQASSAVSSSQIDWQGSAQQQLTDATLAHASTDTQLDIHQFRLEQPGLEFSEQKIALSGRLETDPKHLTFSGSLQTLPAQLSVQQLRLETQSAHWQGAVAVDLASAAVTAFSGAISVGPLQLNHQSGAALVAFQQLQLKQIQLPQPNQLEAASLQLQQLVLGADQPLLSLDKLDINRISASPARTHVGQIYPGVLTARLDLDSDKQPHRWLTWLEQLSGSPATEATAAAPTAQSGDDASPSSAPYPFKLGEFALQKPARIAITEQPAASAKPGKPLQLSINTLSLKELDSRSDQLSPFVLKAQANRFGSIELDGGYALFAESANAHWQGVIANLELPPFSPMMRSQTGYQIDSGKLELASQGTIKQGWVESSNNLTLNNLSVNPGRKDGSEQFDAKLGMPLGTALSLLTDSDDNVTLKLPVNGKLSDPSFGIQSVLNTVMTKVAREAALGYLTVALQPYGALFTLTRLAKHAVENSAINLEPVYFEQGSAELSAQGSDYLDKIAAMLNARNGLRLKLCGLSVGADQAWLLSQRPLVTAALAQTTASAAQPALPAALSEQEQAQLLQLAEERGFRVKTQLLSQHQVSEAQLFSCLAAVDPLNESRPQVRIGL